MFANIPAIEAMPTPANPNILASPVCGLDGLVVFELFSPWLPLLFEVFPPFELFPPWFSSLLPLSPFPGLEVSSSISLFISLTNVFTSSTVASFTSNIDTNSSVLVLALYIFTIVFQMS